MRLRFEPSMRNRDIVLRDVMENSHSRREFLIGSAGTAVQAAAQQPRNVPIIDCHTHAGTGTTLTAPWTTIADPAGILRRNHEAGEARRDRRSWSRVR